MHELCTILNGVAVEVADLKDWEQPDRFLQALREASTFEDCLFINTRRLRYHRGPMADREAAVLVLHYSTVIDGAAVRLVNGRAAPAETWRCTAVPADDLPLLNGGPTIAPCGMPWDDLSIIRFIDAPWLITHGGREAAPIRPDDGTFDH
ncbi:MAG: hypothetical protein K9N51_12075 [Candidatus Pacebacteria bacterium]|nr:hypothetical protein [Candidatus Paceibacterota bacterium]